MPQGQPQAKLAKHYDHKHPEGTLRYFYTCPACRAEDLARSQFDVKQVEDEALERTSFLIPDNEYDNGVVREYLKIKYPDAPYITSVIDLDQLNGWAADEQIVVIRRDPWPETPGQGWDLQQDKRGQWIQVKLPYKSFVQEIREMAPIKVRDALVHSKEDRFTKRKTDWQKLIALLSEHMPLPYRPDMPRHKNDSLLRFVYCG